MPTPAEFLQAWYDRIHHEADGADQAEPWHTRLTLIAWLAEFDWADAGALSAVLREMETGRMSARGVRDPAAYAAFAGHLRLDLDTRTLPSLTEG